jgi:hypothetical protein
MSLSVIRFSQARVKVEKIIRHEIMPRQNPNDGLALQNHKARNNVSAKVLRSKTKLVNLWHIIH